MFVLGGLLLLCGRFDAVFALVVLSYAVCIWALGGIVLRLWHSRMWLLAVLLIPAILLRFLLPKHLRLAIKAMPAAADSIHST